LIKEAFSLADLAAAKAIIREYADYLGEDQCFQGLADAMARCPATYEHVLPARVDGAPAAAVGFKRRDDVACALKRLYARPAFRGLGLGERLCRALLTAARDRGFKVMRLDMLSRLTDALGLYRRLGFREITPYDAILMNDVIYMERSPQEDERIAS
jgi:ribosomal protein S18 acetylase RimI-like enzyme